MFFKAPGDFQQLCTDFQFFIRAFTDLFQHPVAFEVVQLTRRDPKWHILMEFQQRPQQDFFMLSPSLSDSFHAFIKHRSGDTIHDEPHEAKCVH